MKLNLEDKNRHKIVNLSSCILTLPLSFVDPGSIPPNTETLYQQVIASKSLLRFPWRHYQKNLTFKK